LLVSEYPLSLRSRWGWDGAPVLTVINELLAEHSSQYEDAVAQACELAEWAATILRSASSPGEPCWENDWWGTVDALVQCAYLRSRDPVQYIEIGSGYSTMFARRAIRDFGLRTRITSIDPQPRAEIDGICDEVIRRPLQDVAQDVVDRLCPGDILLVDGSHTALMNSDATVLFLELLPSIPPNVMVAIDDVFLPWDYPPSWLRRGYAEQYLLAAFLLGGGSRFELRFPGWWVVERSELSTRFETLWPVVENRFGRHATSFWLEST
jgi:hypothetical protein